jgi:hypothetical protein
VSIGTNFSRKSLCSADISIQSLSKMAIDAPNEAALKIENGSPQGISDTQEQFESYVRQFGEYAARLLALGTNSDNGDMPQEEQVTQAEQYAELAYPLNTTRYNILCSDCLQRL